MTLSLFTYNQTFSRIPSGSSLSKRRPLYEGIHATFTPEYDYDRWTSGKVSFMIDFFIIFTKDMYFTG